MASELRHRGPDDAGFWFERSSPLHLGFRRLAIQDLTSAGHQPMTSRTRRYTVCFNGEIYNFRELQNELRLSRSELRGHSDTEVMLAAFERWGVENAVRRFQGMFSFALYDSEQSCLWLGRDRIGIKPLYLAHGPNWLVFGSELRTLLVHPRVARRGSRESAWRYLRSLYVPSPYSIVDGVEKLQAGTLARFEVGQGGVGDRQTRSYWSLAEIAATGLTARKSFDSATATEALHELIRDSVRSRLVADVPVGTLLSGGVDSSLLAAVMVEQSESPVRTFTISFGDRDFDEGEVAATVARSLGTQHTDIPIESREVVELIPRVSEFCDEPLANPSLLPTLVVSRAARRNVTVALSGDGGDELFGGYNRYRAFPRVLQTAEGLPMTARRLLGKAAHSLASSRVVDRIGRRVLSSRIGNQHSFSSRLQRIGTVMAAPTRVEAYRGFMAVGHPKPPLEVQTAPTGSETGPLFATNGLSVFDSMLLEDQVGYLQDDLLAKVDRASMWASLEVRVPLLDHRIVEFSWRTPETWKCHGGTPKSPLRRIASQYLEPEILDRPKMGFTVPLERWLRGDLRDWLGDRLAPESLSRRGLYDVPAVLRLRDRFMSGDSGLELAVWSVALLEDWCDRFGVEFH